MKLFKYLPPIFLLLILNINSVFAIQNKCNDFVGNYISDYDFSTVDVKKNDNKYLLDLFFYRIAIFENVNGICKNNKINFNFKDKEHNQFIKGSLYKKGNNYILKIDKSNWEDLNIIKKYSFLRK